MGKTIIMKHPENCEQKNPKKVLFICKKRKHPYGQIGDENLEKTVSKEDKLLKSSGLLNSARFVTFMLNNNGVQSRVVDVVDNNSIDREVKFYNPDYVIIEALWVVPEKFEVLTKLYPNVIWIVRLHSEVPFLANEGVAMDWLYKYIEYPNVHIGVNSEDAYEILSLLLNREIYYLPNYYPITKNKNKIKYEKDKNIVDIGCFGAIRPMKNQLQQAISAIEFGDKINKTIHFHMNTERIEGRGEPILNNIRALFKNNSRHRLIEYPWLDHKEFINIVKKMDIGMQVSFSETFNIVTADLVNNKIPVVVSPEISWVSNLFKANPNSTYEIVHKLLFIWKTKFLKLNFLNLCGLKKYNKESKIMWLKYFKYNENFKIGE